MKASQLKCFVQLCRELSASRAAPYNSNIKGTIASIGTKKLHAELFVETIGLNKVVNKEAMLRDPRCAKIICTAAN